MEYRLEEIFDLQMGKTPSRNNPVYWDSNDNKWISIADLSKCGKYITDTKEYLSDVAVKESGISLIPTNTVVMSFKLSIGKTAITAEPMYSNEAIMSFKDKHIVEMLPDYVYYLFLGKDWDAGTNKAVMGKTLNKATLSKVRVNIHSIDKQREIVSVLDKISNLIEKRNAEIDNLDTLIKARFVEMFGRLEEKKFSSVRLGKYVKLQGGFAFKSKDFVDEGIPLVQIGNVNKDYLEWDVKNNVPEEYFDKYREFALEKNDLVMAMTRPIIKSLDSVKIAKVSENDLPCLLNQRVGRFQIKDKLHPIFLEILCKTNDFKDYVERMSGNSLQPNISSKQIEDYIIMLPPLELQEQFADFVHQVDKSKVAVQKALDETQTLFDSLMQEYFG